MDMNEAVPLQAGSSIDRLYRNDATAKVRLAVRKLASLGDNESGAASVRARFTNRCGQGLCRLEVALPVCLESALGGGVQDGGHVPVSPEVGIRYCGAGTGQEDSQVSIPGPLCRRRSGWRRESGVS